MLGTKIIKWNVLVKHTKSLRRIITQRGISNFRGSYYVVSRPANHSDGADSDSNWELFSPEGMRFFMPGGVGPAGHDDVSLSFMTSSVRSCHLKDFKLESLECPVLLRAGLSDLFPATEVVSSNAMTIIKIFFKKSLPSSSEQDMEQLSKQFVCLAEEICETLKAAGFWADFINPFSGSARYSSNPHFYGEDGITCLKSIMEDNGFCKVINTGGIKQTRSRYLGSLYTNAPRSTPEIKELMKASKN